MTQPLSPKGGIFTTCETVINTHRRIQRHSVLVFNFFAILPIALLTVTIAMYAEPSKCPR